MHYDQYREYTRVNIFFAFAIFLFEPILAPYLKTFGLSDISISWIFGLVPLSLIFFVPWLGRWSDRIGRRVLIQGAIVGEIVALILFLFTSHPFLAIFARLLDALGGGLVSFFALLHIEDELENWNRGKLAGRSLALVQFAKVVAPPIGAYLAGRYFFQAPFYVSILLLLVLLFWMFFMAPKVNRLPSISPRRDLLGSLKRFLQNKKLRAMGYLGCAMHASMPATTVFLPLFIIEDLNFSIGYVGFAFFFLGIPYMFQSFFGNLADQYGREKVILSGLVIYAFGLFLLSQTREVTYLSFVLIVQGIGGAMWNIAAWSLLSDEGERELTEGETLGTYFSVARFGALMSFLISGFFVKFFSIPYLFLGNAILILSAVFFSYRYMRSQYSV